MDSIVAGRNIEQIARQRNLFIVLTMLLLLILLIVSIKLITLKEKIVLVPGLNKKVWTSNAGVSTGYLEEMTIMFLPLLLNLNSETIDWNRDKLFNYISQSEAKYLRKMTEYFAAEKEKLQQFDMSTYFEPKKLEVDNKNLKVIVHGVLTSRYGQQGIKTIATSYVLQFEWISGSLKLQEFVRLVTSEKN
ncbi:MAG: type IV conjugative transfer system protein TraE [Rickettsiaceae bacterium]|nr:type IV conjugative transfer system protein TraE [Rickettsiaceae bacterium]